MINNNICLTFHCLAEQARDQIKVHEELFISLEELDRLMTTLLARGYQFGLPFAPAKNPDMPVCAITFDDGYFNNSLFLKLAEKFQAPFILFASTYNIINQKPFFWDICALKQQPHPGFFVNYSDFYSTLPSENLEELESDRHRPFKLEELVAFSQNRYAHIGLHSHHHQPMVKPSEGTYYKEIEANRHHLQKVSKLLQGDFALPNGLYTFSGMKRALKICNRVYTIDGGSFGLQDRIIPRISLTNPSISGPLLSQIDNASKRVTVFRRKLNTVRYSHRIFSFVNS